MMGLWVVDGVGVFRWMFLVFVGRYISLQTNKFVGFVSDRGDEAFLGRI